MRKAGRRGPQPAGGWLVCDVESRGDASVRLTEPPSATVKDLTQQQQVSACFSEYDRVLFLSHLEDDLLRTLAARLSGGLVVVLGSDDETSRGRRQFADLDNVMFVAASAEDIPWQDGFFTQVLDPSGRWADSSKAALETARVRAPNDR